MQLVPVKALVNRTVVSVETQPKGSYAVIRFDDGSTLYADAPTCYAPAPVRRPTRVSHLGYAIPASCDEERFSCRV